MPRRKIFLAQSLAARTVYKETPQSPPVAAEDIAISGTAAPAPAACGATPLRQPAAEETAIESGSPPAPPPGRPVAACRTPSRPRPTSAARRWGSDGGDARARKCGSNYHPELPHTVLANSPAARHIPTRTPSTPPAAQPPLLLPLHTLAAPPPPPLTAVHWRLPGW